MFKKVACIVVAMAFFSNTLFAATATVSDLVYTAWGNKRVTYGKITVTGAGSYASLTPGMVGLDEIDKFIFTGGSAPDYSPIWVSNNIYFYLPYNTYYGHFIDSDETEISSADSIRVHNKALVAADAETLNVYVTVLPGNGGSIAALGAMGSVYGTTEAHVNYNIFMAADSATKMIMGDTLIHPGVGILDASWVHADTVYFDYNSSTRTSRLMYPMRNLGNNGDLFVPFSDGKYIRVCGRTNSQLTQAGAKPLYFIRADGDLDDDKLQCDVAGEIDNYNGFLADSTYTTLPYFQVDYGAIHDSDISPAGTYYFIAVGR